MHGVATIELGGETRVLSFNMHFLMFLCRELNCNPDEIQIKIADVVGKHPLRGLTYIVYCGIIAQYENDFILTHDLTIQKVSALIGNVKETEILGVWNTFAEIMQIPKASQEQIDEYVKKYEKKNNPPKKKK